MIHREERAEASPRPATNAKKGGNGGERSPEQTLGFDAGGVQLGGMPQIKERKQNKEESKGNKKKEKTGAKKTRRRGQENEKNSSVLLHEEQGSTTSDGALGEKTNERPPANNRDALREDVMTQVTITAVVNVLQDYRERPNVKRTSSSKARIWPLWRLRKILGLAHVELHDAVLDGKIDVVRTTLVRYIRKYPNRINERDTEGRSALSLSLMEKREDIADLILSVDQTDVNNPDSVTGLSPMHIAVLLDLTSSAQKLAFRGANINAVDKVGMTPLMLGCRLGHELMTEMLVDTFGAELDPADEAGWTCLFYATYHDELNIARFLLTRGVDLGHEDKGGMKVIDWAEHIGSGEICSLFTRFQSVLAP